MKNAALYLLIIGLLGFSCFFAYQSGKKQANLEHVVKQKEVIKDEKNCANNLLAKPSLNDDAVVRLLDAGRL